MVSTKARGSRSARAVEVVAAHPPACWEMTAGPDTNTFPGPSPFGIMFNGLSYPAAGQLETARFLTSSSDAFSSFLLYPFNVSYVWNIFGGSSILFFPQLTAANWTGPATIPVQFTIMAMAFDFLDAATWQTPAINFSRADLPDAIQRLHDEPHAPPSGDIVLTPGSGFSGNGMVSTAGDVYFAVAQANINVPANTTFIIP